MDFNTAHDIVHQDAGSSEYCGSCNGAMDKDGVMKAAGLIIKRKQSRGGYYGGEKDGEDKNKKGDKKHVSADDDSVDDKTKFLANAITMHKRKVFAFSEIKASEDGKLPNEIQIMPIGDWDTVPYGKLIITSEDLQQMAENFNNGVRAGVPIDIDHDGKAAAGWINDLSVKDDGLYAAVEWTPLGQKMLGEKQYRFFSPEFNPEYVDPENKHLQLSNVLIAGSLVNRPLFKELKPLMAHEGKTGLLTKQNSISMIFIEPMNIDELLKKKKAGQTLTASEQDYVKSYFADDSSKDDDADDEEGKRKGKGDSEGDSFKKSDKAAAGDKAKTMSDHLGGKTTHTISASELVRLQEDAAAGRKAAEELESKKIEETVGGWMFSEDGGHFQPALKNDLVSFVKSLNDAQRKVFGELVDKMPSQQLLFSEKGSSEIMTPGQHQDKITLAARELMEKSKSNGKYTLSFSEAVKQVSQDDQFNGDVKAYDYHKGGIAGVAN